MPKSTDKKRGTKKRKTQNCTLATATDILMETKVTPKRQKLNPDDGIAVSKQLASKLHKRTRTTNPASIKSSVPRICPNGKPMPSLAELEMMYADSDGDEDTKVTPVPERCRTPILDITTLTDDKLTSPTVLKQITSKVIDLISNLPDPIILDDDPPPPVIPQKRPKKSEKPYIDGCKDRRQVPWNPKAVVGKGHDKYGINQYSSSDDDENICPKKRRKKSNSSNISKSIFNAQSDEIAEMLKDNEKLDYLCDSSPDSNNTVPYEYSNISPTRNVTRSFSPLPSTSRDRETILKNDKLFNESFQAFLDTNSNDQTENDVELIDIPCETIVVDDAFPVKDNTVVRPLDRFDDDLCVIVESNNKTKREISPIKIEDDFYSTLDLTQNFDTDVCEVIDIDDVIAENNIFIKKYRTESNLDTITCVDPNVSYVPKRRSSVQNVSPSEHGCTDKAIIDTPFVEISQNINSQHFEQSIQSPVQEININNPQSDVQLSENSNKTNNNGSENNEIGKVVTDLFNTPTIDLTNVQTVFNRISSWMSSVQSYLQGKTNVQDTSTCRCDNASTVTCCNHKMPFGCSSRTNNQINVINVPLQSQCQASKRKRKNVTNPPLGGSPVTIVHTPVDNSQAPTQQMNEAPAKSFGECPICMDSLASNAVASTNCGHVFCMGCIKAAIQANGKKCPTCRKALKGVGYHQLFL